MVKPSPQPPRPPASIFASVPEVTHDAHMPPVAICPPWQVILTERDFESWWAGGAWAVWVLRYSSTVLCPASPILALHCTALHRYYLRAPMQECVVSASLPPPDTTPTPPTPFANAHIVTPALPPAPPPSGHMR